MLPSPSLHLPTLGCFHALAEQALTATPIIYREAASLLECFCDGLPRGYQHRMADTNRPK